LIDQVLADQPQPFITDPIMPQGREERVAWQMAKDGTVDGSEIRREITTVWMVLKPRFVMG